MAPAQGAWKVRGYVQHLGNDDYAYRSMEVYSPKSVDHPLFQKWEKLGIENGNQMETMDENFADGKKPGRKGLAKRMGVPTTASVSRLRQIAKSSSGEKARMAHWLANMKSGRKK
jgi:hypothetical protein